MADQLHENPMKSTFFAPFVVKWRQRNTNAGAVLVTPSGVTQEGLVPVYDHLNRFKLPMGMCWCGCGRSTPLATETCTKRGIQKGLPLRFLPTHHPQQPFSPNEFIRIDDQSVRMLLMHGMFALVDYDDLPQIMLFRWYALNNKVRTKQYAGPRQTREIVLHRMLMCPPKGLVVDHINGDGLDNRRSNLRICTQAENMKNMRRPVTNKTGFKGVHFSHRDQRWEACIQSDKRIYRLGAFDSAVDAAHAYDDAARKYHGAFARVNFPEEGEVAA